MVSIISKDMGTFSAAHQLPFHNGKCSNLHGHDYRVIVEVTGHIVEGAGSSAGMVVDFGVIKQIYKDRVESLLDHSLILGIEPLRFVNRIGGWAFNYEYYQLYQDKPDLFKRVMFENGLKNVVVLPIPFTTAEYLASWMLQQLQEGLSTHVTDSPEARCYVSRVTVYETPTSSASAVYRV